MRFGGSEHHSSEGECRSADRKPHSGGGERQSIRGGSRSGGGKMESGRGEFRFIGGERRSDKGEIGYFRDEMRSSRGGMPSGGANCIPTGTRCVDDGSRHNFLGRDADLQGFAWFSSRLRGFALKNRLCASTLHFHGSTTLQPMRSKGACPACFLLEKPKGLIRFQA